MLAQLQPFQGETVAEHRQHTQSCCHRLAELGMGKLPPDELLTLVRCLAHFDLSLLVKFGVHTGLVQGTIRRLGTERHLPWLDKTSTWESIGCFAMTETDHGSNVRGIETTATYQEGEFVIHTPHRGAWKDYIGSALSAHFAIVFAQLEPHGVHAFLVPLGGEGIHVEDCGRKMGLNGVDNGRLAFHNVRIPRENLLDRYGSVGPDGSYSSPIENPTKRFFTMVGNLISGRLTLAAASVETSMAALCIALRYADRRRQFGPPGEPETRLLDYQMHQKRLIPRLALAAALECGVQHLIELYVGERQEQLETFAAALKAYATWSVAETLRLCRECCGGAGYLFANRFATLKADTDVFTTFEGDNTVLSFLVARNLLKGFRKRDLITLPRLVQAGSLDPVSALRYREDRLKASLARRLAFGTPLNDCQDHTVRLAAAYCERVLVERFADAELAPLYGLGCLEADRAWFLEAGYFSPRQTRQIRREHLDMCARLKEVALARALSFDAPLQADIA